MPTDNRDAEDVTGAADTVGPEDAGGMDEGMLTSLPPALARACRIPLWLAWL